MVAWTRAYGGLPPVVDDVGLHVEPRQRHVSQRYCDRRVLGRLAVLRVGHVPDEDAGGALPLRVARHSSDVLAVQLQLLQQVTQDSVSNLCS